MENEDLNEREKALNDREEELNEREKALNEREEAFNKEDTETLIKEVKDGYENKLLKQQEEFNKRLGEREKVIKQLLSDDANANKSKVTVIDLINMRRSAQNKKW